MWVRADTESLPHPGQQLVSNKPGHETTKRVETTAATTTLEDFFTCHPIAIVRTSRTAQLVKNLPANAGNVGLSPTLGRSPGEGNSNPFQYSCLGNPMDRGAWLATVHGVAKEADMTKQTIL